MITCYIDKKITYPATQSDVKITLLNPFIKDGDEKTMEVTFPMSIPENRAVFGTLNRLDTHFRQDNFEDCILLADGQEVIHGTGTVTSVTESEVKLQILCGRTYLRFKESFDKIYIDDINYGELSPRHLHLYGKPQLSYSVFDLSADISNHGFIGEPGRYAFLPIHDETNDWHLNLPSYLFVSDPDSHDTDGSHCVGTNISFPAIQPNLMYVMEKVIEALGYTLESNYYDTSPWNRIYVASAKMTLVMARALPHWSAYKFLDEFRKLFNAAFMFDEAEKSVKIVPFGDSGGAGCQVIEPLDEFKTSFDEEGVEYLGASNLQYELSDSERDYDFISQDVMSAFRKREYNSYADMYTAFGSMTQKDKLTSIFHCSLGFFYGVPLYDEQGEDITDHVLRECGWFSPLVRREGGSTIALKIVPVATMAQKSECAARVLSNWERVTGAKGWLMRGGQRYEFFGYEANISCDYPANENINYWYDGDKESNDLEYVTVQDVIEDGESVPDRSDEDTVMEIFFASGRVLNPPRKWRGNPDTGNDYDFTVQQPVAFTDSRQAWTTNAPAWGLGLNQIEGVTCVGAFHNSGVKIRQNVNGNNEICFQFLFDGKPDPRKIYIVRNRKFVCSKIEMAVGERGIDRLKTGYFYEML